MMHSTENNRYIVQVYVGALSALYEALSVEASKQTTSEEIVSCIVDRLSLMHDSASYELAEVIGDDFGQECKERSLSPHESPVQLMMLWPKHRPDHSSYRFYLREKVNDYAWRDQFVMDPQLIKDYFHRFLYQPKDREYPDLCQLPDLNEQTLLDNLRARFVAGHIYTYVGSILIALNPFKFYPIYNPKYVKLYQNRRLGPNLPPHIFAVADTAYHCMLKDRKNQCIVISGESGSGKTESTNFLLHHLTALSQKGSHGSGVEQTILSAGPVLEAFGNAKTAHNNNSSRFGKFIQVNYKENGMVHGAVVQKYLLEKSRICSQGRYERNYHVFYYLLEGANEQEKQQLHLKRPDQYYYLNKSCSALDNTDESYEFSRLKQSMEMVGFTTEKQRRLFSVLSAVLLLGNVEFQPRKSAYHHDESVGVKNPEVVSLISELLRVKQETLMQALTAKRARASGETLVINYRLPEAIASRDAMAKCLYGALFDWIVLQVNHALLAKKDTLREHQGNSIGVLDIFGFEDFGLNNSFEQLCINYANEHLQYYFNQHVFKYEQEEYRKEGIRWTNIEFMDNTGCLQLIEGKPNGLIFLLDDQCNFPGATNETLLQKFNTVHKDNKFYQKPQKKEGAFIIVHYAGKVKYQVTDMREKNLDLMRQDIVGVLKNSSMAFVRELVGADPVAVFRWAIVRAFFRAYFAFHEAGRKHRQGRVDGNKNNIQQRYSRNHIPNENLISHLVTVSAVNLTINRIAKNKSFRPRERSKKGLKNLQTVKTLVGRTGITAQPQGQLGKARKQPMTVTAQFQQSLHSLMDTLNQANPFFIRCIKSNGNKIPNTFDEQTVQRQLRYTGMLETVRIRQAGFNVRLTYDEFIQLYRILLPKGLLSSQIDVRDFLATLNLNRDNYQLGSTKVFMRETEKYKLDCKLHQQIMSSIVTLQRWFRACLERRRFLRIRTAVITLQSYCRMYIVQKYIRRLQAVLKIQKYWRGYKCRSWLHKLKTSLIVVQAHCRGFRVRKMIMEMKMKGEMAPKKPPIVSALPTHLQVKHGSSDEAFVSKDSSLEEVRPEQTDKKFLDSDESSGVPEDDIDTSTHPKISLRSTVSLPSVSTTVPAGYYHHHYVNNSGNYRFEELKPEKITLDAIRKKSSKSHQTIDYSDLEYTPQRKGSGDSLGSQRSLESQQSSDSHSSVTVRELHKQEPPTLDKQWSSSSTTSDPFSEGGASQSAPPILRDRSMWDREPVTREYYPKQPLSRTEAVNNWVSPVIRKDVRYSENKPLRSYQPVRRPREKFLPDDRPDVYPYDQTPNKLEQILGRPEAPIRNTRKSKRGHVKSLGEEVTDSGSLDKSVFLGTIDESKAHPEFIIQERNSSDAGNKQTLTPKRQRQNLPQLDLRRRNSDPATKAVISDNPAGLDASPSIKTNDYKYDVNALSIAGHTFRKIPRISKDDLCMSCNAAIDAFYAPGYKCTNCKKQFHTKCIQNKVFEMPCEQQRPNAEIRSGRRKHRKHSRTPYDLRKPDESKFSLTGTSEFTDRTDQIITGAEELTLMQQFITDKIMKMESVGGKNSDVDKLFKQALRDFKDNLVQIYSNASKHNNLESCNIKYKDLILVFNQAMETVCQREQKSNDAKDFPVTMGVNAFRGFMDEFMSSRAEEKPSKSKRKKEKKRKLEMHKHNGHAFLLTIINIPTACEICSSFFMWPIERGLVCQSCKMTCHKKCYLNANQCLKEAGLQGETKRVFGVPLVTLVTEDNKIPLVIEKLLSTIELHGLYAEGIYRKSGVSSKIKELKNKMDENPDEVEFEKYQVHVLASVLKSFLREMAEPLLTFECYENFITAANLEVEIDRVTTLYDILKKLPPPNYDLMERLMFHLARVALHEETNRMSAASLAIVFAPCVLRTNKVVPAQESLIDISSQTQCIETIIRVQLKKIRSTLDDIDTLDTACQAATNRLSSLRSSKVFTPDELIPPNQPSQQPTDEEEHLLEDHIQEIQKEKEHLTSTLPTLTHATSDDDMLSTDGDGSLDDLTCLADKRHNQRPIVRSISTGPIPKLRRQLSTETKCSEDCPDDPIMV
ncbi:unconventional myosin-IXAa-like isoform X2 [Diorhabda sublineata]|uniref:unconventional myosin-IXAa-like isoform X2 n=1 Tax=Diorhabda sublineata TaxID=1163346 RepID=UPI0024E0F48E|nr:unconventional myosin-IXAa-like isoform X2 [Diorhabda sublineata]